MCVLFNVTSALKRHQAYTIMTEKAGATVVLAVDDSKYSVDALNCKYLFYFHDSFCHHYDYIL